jgi:hypothetical protein
VLEDLFASDDVGVNRTRDKIPSVVGDQSIIFFFHGTVPGRSVRVVRMEVADNVSLSAGSQKSRFACVVIK